MESVYSTLFLDHQKSGKFQIGVKDEATVDGLCGYVIPPEANAIEFAKGEYIHILREASALSVQLQWAIPEPLMVEWTSSIGSHAFFCLNNADNCESIGSYIP